VKELTKRGAKVTVFTLHYPFTTEKYSWYATEVFPLNGANSFLKRKLILKSNLEKRFNAVNAKSSFDVIHSFWLNEATVFACELGEKYNLPVIASAQGQDALPSNTYLTKVKNFNPKIASMSLFQAEKLTASNIHSEVIHWGVDVASIQSKKIDFIAVGNLIELKNFSYFIQLCNAYKKSKPDFKAIIIGEGKEEKKLKTMVRDLELEENLLFKGQCSHEETLLLIAQAKVLIHPSSYEGFGMVLIEALVNGTHVLSSPVGVAYQNKHVSLLTFDLNKDIQQLQNLLLAEPQSHLYPISETVNQYLKLY